MDDGVLEQLVTVAVTAASADEVTPPSTAGSGWTPGRVTWLRDEHRRCRAGLNGPAGAATWAVAVDGQIVGSVRLRRTDEPDVLETGIWLSRAVRNTGVGRAAVQAVLNQASRSGAVAVRADTTTANVAALAVLHRMGAALTYDRTAVRAMITLKPGASSQ